MFLEPWDVEEWATVPGFPMYIISTAGRVASYKDPHLGHPRFFGDNPLRVRHDGQAVLLTQQVHRLGYLYVNLSKYGDERPTKCYIHRLVASAFIPNPYNKPEINHINGDKQCNYVFNLEWCTRQENMDHALRTGLINEETRRKVAESNMVPVYCYELDRVFESMDEASMELGIFKSSICLCCQRKSRCAGGYHFCYADEKEEFLESISSIRSGEHGYRPVKAIRVDTGEEVLFSSRNEASEALGIPASYISNIIAGRCFSIRGWTFEDASVKGIGW